MSKKKGVALMLAGAMAVVAGCGGTGNSGAGGGGATTPDGQTGGGAAQKVTISFWHGMSPQSAHGETLEALVAEYNASQNEVEVLTEYHGSYSDLEKKVTSAIAANIPPTVVQATDSMLTKLVLDRAVADITAQVAGERDDYTEAMLQALTFDGKLMALPFNKSALVLVYDKAVVPTPPTNWTEFEQVAKDVTDSGAGRYGTAFNADVYYFGTHFAQAGGQWLTADGQANFNSPAGVQAMDLIARMAREGSALQLQPGEYQSNYFNEGRAAMIATTSASFAFLNPIKPEIEVDVAPLYAGPGGAAVPLSGANVALIEGVKPEEAEAAMKFMLWLTGTEGQLKWGTAKTGYVPVRKSAVNSAEWQAFVTENPWFAVLGESLEKGVVQPNHPRWGDIQKQLTTAVEKVVQGTSTSQQALDEAAQYANTQLAR